MAFGPRTPLKKASDLRKRRKEVILFSHAVVPWEWIGGSSPHRCPMAGSPAIQTAAAPRRNPGMSIEQAS